MTRLTPFQDDCASEPIQTPGAIQPHGFLVSLRGDGRVAQVSANIADWALSAAESLLDGPLSAAIGNEAAARVEAKLSTLKEGETLLLGTVGRASTSQTAPQGGAQPEGVSPPTSDQSWALVLHRYGGVTLVELEQTRREGDVFDSMYPLVRAFLTGIQPLRTVTELAELAAREIAAITGFGRTLVYTFEPPDGHGQVLAEALLDGYDSYHGQRFPASDIPAQARALYKQNRIRLIADADYVPQPLVPTLHPDTHAPTDLTVSSLRSVSPVHIRYMQNMRTRASMSMSIVVGDKLWGLISCHHAGARVPPFEVRIACEHIAQLLSLQIEAREAQAEAAHRLLARSTLSALLAKMTRAEHFVEALVSDSTDLLAITASQGAAIVFEGRTTRIGLTPSESNVDKLVSWLVDQPDDLVHSDHAAKIFPWAAEGSGFAGFCAVSLSKVFRNYVIWFRPEVIETISWAGDPRAKLSSLSGTMSPRESFDVWTETVRERSVRWGAQDLEVAAEFRTALLAIVLARAEELANLALELTQANRELEEFSYTVSHDLRAPLRHIHNFAALLNDMDGDKLSDRGRSFIGRIIGASELGGRLVDELLAFAQMGRAAIESRPVDLGEIVKEIVDSESVDASVRVTWQIGPLPVVNGDVIFLRRAVQNLVSNAIKFTKNRENPIIAVGAYAGTDDRVGFDVVYVKDNGVGFDMAYADKLFRVFQRLHRDDDFEGTGIGLANVRRIVERHGGDVWATARPNEGATFYFSLPREVRAAAHRHRETPAAAVARMAATGALAPTGGVRKKDA